MFPSTVAGMPMTFVEIPLLRKYSLKKPASVKVWVAPMRIRPVKFYFRHYLPACSYYSMVLK